MPVTILFTGAKKEKLCARGERRKQGGERKRTREGEKKGKNGENEDEW